MKKLIFPVLLAAVLGPIAGHAAETAQARMHCQSVRFFRATGGGQFGFDRLDLTTLSAGINGELGYLGGSYSHWSGLEVYDELFEELYTGLMNLNTPAFQDANGNGCDDFFEVSQDSFGNSSGVSSFGSVQAQWSRGAGSAYGTCVLTLQQFGDFVHTFQIIEYTGTLTFTPGSNTVSGGVSLTQTDDPLSQLGGPAQFVKAVANRFNVLTNQLSTWTNALTQTLPFYQPHVFQRNLTAPTNYSGFVEFLDGELTTGEDDYYLWTLWIGDPNDADHDGIPDFSDDLQSVLPPRRPSLLLTRGTGDLQLRISGDVGHLHHVQELTSLSNTNWQTVVSVTLTNDPQTVSLPLPAGLTKFWRVLAQ